MTLTAQDWLAKIKALPLKQHVRIMNVCGGHERSITMAGIRSALPKTVELIAGPGCPVCICPEEDVYQAIQLALHGDVILVAFGLRKILARCVVTGVASLADAGPADLVFVRSPRHAEALAARERARFSVRT